MLNRKLELTKRVLILGSVAALCALSLAACDSTTDKTTKSSTTTKETPSGTVKTTESTEKKVEVTPKK
jgi:maltose-binding protein MalE